MAVCPFAHLDTAMKSRDLTQARAAIVLPTSEHWSYSEGRSTVQRARNSVAARMARREQARFLRATRHGPPVPPNLHLASMTAEQRKLWQALLDANLL